MLYDTIIIGAGPAGLTASIYASRYRLSNLVIGKMPGGTVTYAHKIENFPGVPNISGAELGQKMLDQAKNLGAEILAENVGRVEKEKEGFTIITESNKLPHSKLCGILDEGPEKFVSSPSSVQQAARFSALRNKELVTKTLIIASGTERRKLNIPGEKEYLGKGISYCTSCDAPFFKDKTVILVGGANAACSGAVHLSEYAQKVYLIYRKGELRAEPVWIEEVKSNPKIEVIYNTNLAEILGDGTKVTGANLDVPYNGSLSLSANGVFVEIGGVPASSFLIPLGVELDENRYVKVNDGMETNIAGIFAAGDITTKNLILQQTVTACASGAVAAYSAFKYLRRK